MRNFLLATLAIILFTGCGGNWGKKVSKDYLEVYYKDGMTEADAKKTLDFLHPLWKEASKGEDRSVQLIKKSDTIHFRMVVNESKLDEVTEDAFLGLAGLLSEDVFDKKPVNIDLTDKQFSTIRTIVFRKLVTPAEEEPITAGNIEVYRLEGVSEGEASQLAQYLDNLDGAGGTNRKTMKLGKEADGSYKLMMVYDAEYAKSVPDEEFIRMTGAISNEVLGGAPVLLVLTDKYYQPFKTIPYKPGNAPAETPAQ